MSYEYDPEVLHGDLSSELGPEHGGRVAQLDGALPVRVREVNLGYGRHPVEGPREAKALHELPTVRPIRLAHRLP